MTNIRFAWIAFVIAPIPWMFIGLFLTAPICYYILLSSLLAIGLLGFTIFYIITKSNSNRKFLWYGSTDLDEQMSIWGQIVFWPITLLIKLPLTLIGLLLWGATVPVFIPIALYHYGSNRLAKRQLHKYVSGMGRFWDWMLLK